MKKTIASVAAFCLMLALSATISFAQNTATGSTSWGTEVEIPINVIAGPTVDLGKIAPGTTRTFTNPSAMALTFDVTGAPNVPFLMTKTETLVDNGLELGAITWQYYNGNNWVNLRADGKYSFAGSQGGDPSVYAAKVQFRALPSTLTCPNAAQAGTQAQFTVTLTATYTNY